MINNLSLRTRTLIATALIGSVAVAGGLLVADINSPTLTMMEKVAQEISVAQEDFFEKNGKYWYGKSTNDNWNDFVVLPLDAPFAVVLNSYETPWDGHGYESVFIENGTTTRIGFGPEAKSRTSIHIKAIIHATST